MPIRTINCGVLQMSHTRTFRFSFVIAGLLLAGCSSKEHEAVVATVGDKPVTLKEYELLYIKSSGSREAAAKSTQEEREKFLDLVTKFKLKLTDAYDQKLDKKPELLAEIDQYKSSLASSFLTDREISSPGAREMYDRRSNEYRASHILISLSQTPSKEDSIAAYAKADSVIAKLRAGAPFDSLAIGYSQDPSVSQNKGDLYYFTAGQMVPPFEDAVFGMKPGEITQKPVRTQFGLHIIKLTDRRPPRGEIKASHIMIRFDKQDPTPEDTLTAYQHIKLIQDSLKMGIDFADLAIRNSGDPGSASKGGDLGWFQRRRWIQSFDEVVQTLKPGETSGIVRTIYGYHLIKCYDERPPKSFDEAKKDMHQLYQQTRFQDDYKAYFAKLQKETQYKLHEDVLALFIAALDSNKTTKDSAWWSTIPTSVGSAGLITFGTRGVSVDSIVKLINNRPDFGNTPLRDPGIRNMVDKIAESLVFAVKAETLEEESPEFRSIMKEYTDGILLYQIEQDRVWNSVVVNDSLLKHYFSDNRDKFMFPDRVDFTELRASDDSVAQLVYTQTKRGKKLEDIAAEDSARMAMKSNFQVNFAANSAKLSATTTKALAPVLKQLKADAALRAQLTTHPDTSAKKAQNTKLAGQRIKTIKDYFKKQGIPEARVPTFSQPYNRKAMADSLKDKNALNLRVTVDIIGRRAIVAGRLEIAILPVTTDERAAMADSLQVSQISAPFRSKYGISIVRLNKKDPLRQKTFDEAGTEVSSSFQEYESKRLEREWIDGLTKKYPVVSYKEVLKSAFAPQM
jgi:peptidyl-prolyl cis-trans isomerase SurA